MRRPTTAGRSRTIGVSTDAGEHFCDRSFLDRDDRVPVITRATRRAFARIFARASTTTRRVVARAHQHLMLDPQRGRRGFARHRQIERRIIAASGCGRDAAARTVRLLRMRRACAASDSSPSSECLLPPALSLMTSRPDRTPLRRCARRSSSSPAPWCVDRAPADITPGSFESSAFRYSAFSLRVRCCCGKRSSCASSIAPCHSVIR